MEQEISNKYIGVNTDDRGLKIYTYTQKCQFEEHWNEYTCKARGLVMYGNRVILRCIPKFFNMGQEGAADIDISKAQITEKNDGYLIQIKRDSEFGMIVTSKGSFESPMARKAEGMISPDEFKMNWTYICELCCNFEGDEGTIVKRWNGEKLVCWAVRNQYGEEEDIATVELPKCLERVKVFTMDEMKRYMKRQDVEGVVAKLGTERVKIKTDRYLELHRLLSNMTPRRILELVQAGTKLETLDLPDEFLPQAKKWYKDFQNKHDHYYYTAKNYAETFANETDKWIATCGPIIPTFYRALVFALRKNKDVDGMIYRKIREGLKNESS